MAGKAAISRLAARIRCTGKRQIEAASADSDADMHHLTAGLLPDFKDNGRYGLPPVFRF
ncbi:Uncharacterised protein [Kingella potus]|uniref:Uncharacterized protein n=1 Tax=Kingella potus TaxID=265175 RepID=A0A377QZ53_9NEIS|nr:hypothetical protein [Kingella potus]UOP01641.1 hypothetical protein LVJ84_05685 [Kingella potus]STR00065.1 Uncharacterised protein [Kingella potus]